MATAETFQSRSFTIKLWPPSQSTRLMLVERMIKNLSSETIFSRKYGVLSKAEAEEAAKEIEEKCFNAANDHFQKEPDGDGSSAVQLYAKETSKLMLEVLKRGPQTKEADEVTAVNKEQLLTETVFDISGGRRAFIEAEEASELLKPLTKEGNSYKKICFSNRSFGIDAARVAEPILVSLKGQLTDVDLSDFIAGRPEEEALDVIRIFSKALEGCVLRYLNLSNNALGEKGIRAFGALLASQNSLEELILMNDGISEEAAKAVCELVPSTDKLKILHFHNNMTGDEGALAISEMLKRSPALEDFRCSSTRVDSEGGIALAEALRSCPRLKKLDIRDNMFGPDAGKALAKTLEQLDGITELYLSYLNLENEGALSIINALKDSAPALEVLEMAGNDITTEAANTLAACLASKQLFRKVSLAENELKDAGAVIIGKTLEKGHVKLKELDMSSNMIRRVGARCLANAVVSKPEFELLNIDGNAISDEGIYEVKDLLKKGGKSLDVLGTLDENDPEGEEEEEDDEVDNSATKEEDKSADDNDEVDDSAVKEEEKSAEEDLESKLQNIKIEQD